MRGPSASGRAARALGDLAVRALELEVALRGKPGLVCPDTPGSHDDMDFHLYMASAESLRDCFAKCAAAGFAFEDQRPSDPRPSDPRALLPLLRPIGIEGERSMFAATGGVNTHKGAIFCLGLLAARAGVLTARPASAARPAPGAHAGDEILDGVRAMCRGLVSAELRRAPATAGGRLYRAAGLAGARGQAETGYPIVRDRMLPILRARGLGDATLLDALLASIEALDDSCLHARGGMEALDFARNGAANVRAAGGAGTEAGAAALAGFAEEMKRRRLSPGGSADMLSCAIFLQMYEMAEEEFHG